MQPCLTYAAAHEVRAGRLDAATATRVLESTLTGALTPAASRSARPLV